MVPLPLNQRFSDTEKSVYVHSPSVLSTAGSFLPLHLLSAVIVLFPSLYCHCRKAGVLRTVSIIIEKWYNRTDDEDKKDILRWTALADTKTCIFVRELIPKYLNGDCSKAENILIKDHCTHCQECRALLQMARMDRQSEALQMARMNRQNEALQTAKMNRTSDKAEDVKEVLFLSRLLLPFRAACCFCR